jgi:hypothetical protein
MLSVSMYTSMAVTQQCCSCFAYFRHQNGSPRMMGRVMLMVFLLLSHFADPRSESTLCGSASRSLLHAAGTTSSCL